MTDGQTNKICGKQLVACGHVAADSNQLSLNVGDEVLVRQVAAHGWAFGHLLSDRRQGWFPTCLAGLKLCRT